MILLYKLNIHQILIQLVINMKNTYTQYYCFPSDGMILRSGKSINNFATSELYFDISAMTNKTNKYFDKYSIKCATVYCLIDVLNKYYDTLKNNSNMIRFYYIFKQKVKEFICVLEENVKYNDTICGCDDIKRQMKEDKTLEMVKNRGPGNYHFAPPVSTMYPDGDMEADVDKNTIWVSYAGIKDVNAFKKKMNKQICSWRHSIAEQIKILKKYDNMFDTPHNICMNLLFPLIASNTNDDCSM